MENAFGYINDNIRFPVSATKFDDLSVAVRTKRISTFIHSRSKSEPSLSVNNYDTIMNDFRDRYYAWVCDNGVIDVRSKFFETLSFAECQSLLDFEKSLYMSSFPGHRSEYQKIELSPLNALSALVVFSRRHTYNETFLYEIIIFEVIGRRLARGLLGVEKIKIICRPPVFPTFELIAMSDIEIVGKDRGVLDCYFDGVRPKTCVTKFVPLNFFPFRTFSFPGTDVSVVVYHCSTCRIESAVLENLYLSIILNFENFVSVLRKRELRIDPFMLRRHLQDYFFLIGDCRCLHRHAGENFGGHLSRFYNNLTDTAKGSDVAFPPVEFVSNVDVFRREMFNLDFRQFCSVSYSGLEVGELRLGVCSYSGGEFVTTNYCIGSSQVAPFRVRIDTKFVTLSEFRIVMMGLYKQSRFIVFYEGNMKQTFQSMLGVRKTRIFFDVSRFVKDLSLRKICLRLNLSHCGYKNVAYKAYLIMRLFLYYANYFECPKVVRILRDSSQYFEYN